MRFHGVESVLGRDGRRGGKGGDGPELRWVGDGSVVRWRRAEVRSYEIPCSFSVLGTWNSGWVRGSSAIDVSTVWDRLLESGTRSRRGSEEVRDGPGTRSSVRVSTWVGGYGGWEHGSWAGCRPRVTRPGVHDPRSVAVWCVLFLRFVEDPGRRRDGRVPRVRGRARVREASVAGTFTGEGVVGSKDREEMRLKTLGDVTLLVPRPETEHVIRSCPGGSFFSRSL